MNEYFTLCNTRRAHVNEFFTLAQQILQAAKEMLAETEAQPRIATYESAVTAFDEALKQSTKNSYTGRAGRRGGRRDVERPLGHDENYGETPES